MAYVLSIIIVNYRSSALIIDSVNSICRFHPGTAFEIIVIDNSSGDDSRNKVLQAIPSVKWIDMPYNAGFARANNAGMRAAKGDMYLLLNPDTIALDNSIAQCAERLSNSALAAAGVQLLDAAHEPQISGSHFVKGGLNHLLPIPYWGSFIRWIGYRANAKVPGVQQAVKIEEVDWISGAFLMVKKSTVEKAGLMDEDFFLYGEEVEWCSRLRKVGRLAIFGDMKMIHLEGATINKSQKIEEKGYYNLYDRKGLQLMVSNHLRVRKQFGVFWFLFLLLNYTFGIFVFLIASTFHYLFLLQNPFKQWKRVGDYTKNVFIIWTLSPKILRNKPHFYKMFGS